MQFIEILNKLSEIVIGPKQLYLLGAIILVPLNMIWLVTRKPLRFFIAGNLFIAYLLYLINLTLLPVPFYVFTQPLSEGGLYGARINLMPFSIGRYGSLAPHFNMVDFLNIVAFVPFGFLLPFMTKKRSLPIILYALLASLIIETLQLIFSVRIPGYSRVFDITDIIVNVFGAWIGYLIARLVLMAQPHQYANQLEEFVNEETEQVRTH